jgi:hypothetical protein
MMLSAEMAPLLLALLLLGSVSLVVTTATHEVPNEVPAWLRQLEAPSITQELRQLADADDADDTTSLFAAQFGPNTDLAEESGDWQALSLMNKGRLLAAGCEIAPATCAALSRLQGHLAPRGASSSSSEVGVRILKLAPGGKLRPHRGPGGRLVAHLGIKIPSGAFLTVAGERREWREGGLTVFDDSVLHSAENPSQTARYILHIAFPLPAKLIGSTGTAHFRLDFFSDCGVVATSLHTQAQSHHEELMFLYNRVSDNQPADFEPCVGAVQLLPSTQLDGTSASNGTLRIAAAHGYGTIDVGYYAGANWVVFEVSNLELWKADPKEKHLFFTQLCPADLCPSGQGYPPPGPKGKVVGGKFDGWRGAEGSSPSPFSSGYLTISSDWQFSSSMYYVKKGWKVAHTYAPTADLPTIWAGVAKTEGIVPPNKNRARTWLWSGATEQNLDSEIKIAKEMGVELLFIEGITSNIGDYRVNTKSFPSGLGAIRGASIISRTNHHLQLYLLVSDTTLSIMHPF